LEFIPIRRRLSNRLAEVALELYSEKELDKPSRKALDSKAVERIWADFQPYFAQKQH
jgi:hypothetical protein